MYILISFFFFFLSSMLVFLSIYLMYFEVSVFFEWEMMSFNSFELNYVILMDWMSSLFMSLVLMISSMVILYSHSYMSQDKNKIRFLWMVVLFVMFMLLLIISPNLFSLMLGWDGLGVVSFCLVVFFQNNKSYNAGVLTVLSNRVGDVFLFMLLGFSLNFMSWSNYIFSLDLVYDRSILGILLILVSITKSAQIPFSSWLPAAMAAPTPVSALVHSSTLVTAGIYLLVRFYELFQIEGLIKVLFILGVLTMFMASIGGIFEFDLKKIVALSTLSQLGLMFVSLGLGLKFLSMFHLLSHAFFKALLFLCAGVLIHSMNNFQDIRYMGGVFKYFPFSYSCFMVANFSLMGLFFMSGFYSKDLILEMMCLEKLNYLIYVLLYMSVMLTIFYTMRLIYYLFLNDINSGPVMNYVEEDYFMFVSMFFMMMLSVMFGSYFKWMMNYSLNFIYLYIYMKLMVVYLMVLSSVFMIYLMFNMFYFKNMIMINYLNSYMWFLSVFTLNLVNFKFLKLSFNFNKYLDKGWIEYIFVKNLNDLFKLFMNILMLIQFNLMMIMIFFFFVFILLIYLY
uniref:NADH dehydrogenase subunit 5 n=1 Tax=Setodes brevicaudatus TaxID=1876047 RepID=UPI0022DCDBB4|nr:NADH dehydrogenase subunit 5 [Setodes brevicaudatus]UZZ44384.1 NADH dehydrogenase subunit 5 [Setodes brevicaudatus]